MDAAMDRDNLIPGERVVLRMRPHWNTLVLATATGIAFTVLYVLLVRAVDGWFPNRSNAVNWALFGIYVASLFPWTITGWLRWATTRYVFTDERIITRSGLLRIQGEAISLDKINSVQFTKTLLERVLGSGSLVIETAAENQVIIKHVSHSEQVQREVYILMSDLEERSRERHEDERPRRAGE